MLIGLLAAGFTASLWAQGTSRPGRTTSSGALTRQASKPASLTAASGPFTSKDFEAMDVAFMKRVVLQAYQKKAGKDPKWADAGLEFLQLRTDTFYGDIQETQKKLADLGKAAFDAGCDDPMVLYWYADILRQMRNLSEARACTERALKGFQSGQYSIDFVARSARRLLRNFGNDPQETRRLTKLMTDSVVQTICLGPYNKNEQRLLFLHFNDPLDTQDLVLPQAIFDAVKDSETASPWTINLLGGHLHLRKAWEARGGGYANTVTPQGWQGFEQNLAKARQHLQKAWGLDEKSPEPASEMIEVEMCSGSLRDMQLWFDRAVSAQFDYLPAYSQLRWGMRPRWHGTHQIMIDWARNRVKTGRFDTAVPFELYWVAVNIVDDLEGDWKKALSMPGLYDQLQQMFDGYTAADPDQAAWVRTHKAVLAWRVGRDDQLKDILAKGELDLNCLGELRVTRLDISGLYAQCGPAGELVKAACDLYEGGSFEQSLPKFKDALSKLKEGDYGIPYVKDRIWRAPRLAEFEKGNWVDITLDSQDCGWSYFGGKWRVDETNRVVCDPNESGGMLMSDLPLGNRLEIKAVVSVPNIKYRTDEAGLIFGKPWEWVYVVVAMPADKTIEARPYWDKAQPDDIKNAPFRNIIKMDMAIWDGRCWVTVDDKPVFQDREMKNWEADDKWRVGLGGHYWYSGTTITYRKVLVRKLTQQPSETPVTSPAPAQGQSVDRGTGESVVDPRSEILSD